MQFCGSRRPFPSFRKSDRNSARGGSPSRLVDHVHRANQRLALECLESRCLLSTLYVATNGSDSGAGSSTSPFQTIQKAVDAAKAGDTVIVRAGTYNQGVNMIGLTGGTASNPITVEADPSAAPGSVIVTHIANQNTGANFDAAAFNLESTGSWVIKGFTINGDGSMQKAGIRVANSNNDQVLDNVVNHCFTGIFVSGSTGTVVQGNTCENSTDQHGIYISMNTNGTQVIGNTIFGNNWDGLHMNCSNGNPNQNAVVEDNVIYGNGLSGMDIEGINGAYFANNVIYNNTKHGITVHSQDQTAAGNPTPYTANNTFVNNTISGNGMFGIQFQSGDTQGEVLFNNIFVNSNSSYGAIGVSGTPSGLVSDYNAVVNNFSQTLGTSTETLAQWQSSTGQDKHSIVTSASGLFTSSSNYSLKAGAPAIDVGTASLSGRNAPNVDFSGKARPQGNGYDMGAYEYGSGTTTTDTTPPTLSSISAGNLSTSGATITWTTNEASTSQVDYGTSTSYGSSSSLNSSLQTTHSVTLTGLAPGTTYHFRVDSADAAGNLAKSSDFTFTTAAAQDTTPPTLSAITSSNLSTSGATITWTTNEASTTQVQYGTSTNYGSSTTLSSSLVTSHSAALTGLAAGTTYHYRVLSTDASGNQATSADQTFTTGAIGTGTYNLFSPSTTPSYIETGDSTSYVLGVKFTSDVAGYITGVRFYKAPTNTGTHVGYLWNSSGTLLASATFTNESASGWQQVNFATPVAIQANTTYVAGYYDPHGNYAEDVNGFTNAGINSSPLHAPQSTSTSNNGLYVVGGAGQFPTSSWNNSDYYVDVAFTTAAPPVSNAAPTASLNPTPSVTNGATTYAFSVTYSDNVAINAASIGSNNILVTGPNGFSQVAQLVSASSSANGSPITATYQITAPGGTWDSTDNGQYTISMQAKQVSDTSGNSVSAGSLGTFSVSLTSSTTHHRYRYFGWWQ